MSSEVVLMVPSSYSNFAQIYDLVCKIENPVICMREFLVPSKYSEAIVSVQRKSSQFLVPSK